MSSLDPSPRQAPSHRELRGDTIVLVPLVPERDAPGLYRISHGDPVLEGLWEHLPAGPFAGPDQLRDWYQPMVDAGDPQFYCVRDALNDQPMGVLSLLAIEPEHGCAEIGHIWYSPTFQRTQANTEATYLLLVELFDRLHYRRVEWKSDANNARSRAAALRLGFQFEGIFRQHRITRNRNRDTAWFSMLDGEWCAIKSCMERWLMWDLSVAQRPSLSQLLAIGEG